MFSNQKQDTICEICQSAQKRKKDPCRKIFCTTSFYNFDNIKDHIWRNFPVFIDRPSSCDIIHLNSKGNIILLEIKDRDWKILQAEKEKNKFFKKFYDSLLLLYLNNIEFCNFVIVFSPFKNGMLCSSEVNKIKEKSKITRFLKTEFRRFHKYKYYEITGKDFNDFYKHVKKKINAIDNSAIFRFRGLEPLGCNEVDEYIQI